MIIEARPGWVVIRYIARPNGIDTATHPVLAWHITKDATIPLTAFGPMPLDDRTLRLGQVIDEALTMVWLNGPEDRRVTDEAALSNITRDAMRN
jgi:hypothetical protein